MNPPDFWYRLRDGKPPWQAHLLSPLSALYLHAGARRMKNIKVARARLPVLCVGNLTVGGVGKTPVALALAARLIALGKRPVFLTRGYGGKERGPLQVDRSRHNAEEVGDEALLLARLAPTVVARDRPEGARLASDLGDIIVMDDGFQNPSLAKTFSILVVDAQTGFGNGQIFPAGPLREPVETGLKRAQGLILLGEEAPPPELKQAGLPILRGWIAPNPAAANLFRGRRIAAFAGIGRPEKFFETLRQLGAELVFSSPFSDHHVYSDAEIDKLREHAGLLPLLTTEKDFARLKPHQRVGIETLPVTISFESPRALDALLLPLTASAAKEPDPA